jgi:hypothetical protein
MQMPFINLLKDTDAPLANFLDMLIDPSEEDEEEATASDHFLLLERNALWFPFKQSSEELKGMLDVLDKEHFEPVGQIPAAQVPLFEQTLFRPLKPDENEMWMIGYELKSGFKVEKGTEKDHPLEKENVSIDVEACELGQTKYGLRDAKCQTYKITTDQGAAGGEGINFFIGTPPQSHIKPDPPEEGITDHSGYDIIWEKNGTLHTDVLQRKIELVEKEKVPSINANVLSVDINNRDITQDLHDIFDSDIENLCNPLEDVIRDRMKSIIEGLDFDVDTPFEKRSYVLAGLPPRQYTIADGLESMNLRMGSDGLETHVNFGNIKRKPISPNFFVQQYEAWHDKNRKDALSATNLPKPEDLESL